MRNCLLILLGTLLCSCSGERRLFPDVLRDQRIVHSVAENYKDRITRVVTKNDSTIWFGDNGGTYIASRDLVYGKTEIGMDTTLAVSSLSWVFVQRDDVYTTAISTFETSLLVGVIVLAAMVLGLRGLSTI